MKRCLAFALILAFASSTKAQLPSDARTARSVSGEFVAYPSRPAFTSRYYRGDGNSISLEPAVLAISCERIKQSLWRILDAKAPAKGKIFLHLRPARAALERATIVVERGIDGWDYHLDMPDSLQPTAFLRAIVHASLLEIANRNAQEQTAEIPLWLAEGFSQELLATERIEYLLPPPRTRDNGLLLNRLLLDQRRKDPLEHAQQVLRVHAPLTFEQLSWPTNERLANDEIDVFRSSAQLFVVQLLQLKNGPACLRATLDELPRKFNWQFALLAGFHSNFQTQLDVEKWWALQLVQFTGRDLTRAWTRQASWTKLEEILQSPVEIRSSPLELPRRTEVNLQTIIRDWDGLSQRTALQQKAQELELLRPLVAPELIALVEDYRALLERYLQRQSFSGSFFGLRKSVGPIRNRLAEETIRELDLLDAKRQNLKSAPAQPVTKTNLSAELR